MIGAYKPDIGSYLGIVPYIDLSNSLYITSRRYSRRRIDTHIDIPGKSYGRGEMYRPITIPVEPQYLLKEPHIERYGALISFRIINGPEERDSSYKCLIDRA